MMKKLGLALTVFLITTVVGADCNEPKKFQLWKSVTIGRHADVRAYWQDFRKSGVRAYSDVYLYLFTPFPFPVSIDLTTASAVELGISWQDGQSLSLETIFEQAMKMGLRICPAEAGPALAAEYTDQPVDEKLVIAMLPVTHWNGGWSPDIYQLHNYKGERVFGQVSTSIVDSWSGNTRFVFCLPKAE